VAADTPQMMLYVATDGSDAWSGRLPEPGDGDGPFATLQRARDEIRKLKATFGLPKGGITVEVRGGLYEFEGALELTDADSGAAEAPVTYRARPGEQVRLSGGRVLTNFEPVTDEAVLRRLDEAARGEVWQADLNALGITDFGEAGAVGMRADLLFNDRPMTLARWPNEGFTKIADVLGIHPTTSHGIKGDLVGKFVYEGQRPARWAGEKDAWLHGYWFWDWADAYQRIESVDSQAHVISLVPPHHNYGYRAGQRFYALNLLCELDRPGEWYLDRDAGVLYFWPPGPIADGQPTLSVLPTLIAMRHASHLTLRGFTVEATRGTAITLDGAACTQVAGCTIRNVGGWAVRISGGTQNAVIGCDIYQVGEGGVRARGGERATLTAAEHRVENCVIRDFSRIKRTYRPAVAIEGVGHRVSHNLIYNAPHNAIQLGGNDHVIEFNEIHSVCHETGDVGALYLGRDWTERGTVIRHNFFHHISGPGFLGANAVYLDDAASGTTICGNVFYKAGRAAFIGGGRDNLVENNIFVECDASVHVDARALGWMRDAVKPDGVMMANLKKMPYQDPLWRERYPTLADILDDEPAVPKGNVVARNISWGGKWLDVEDAAMPHVRFEDNLVDEDPHFLDPANMDFRLRDDSPAYALGFKPIPIEQIGVYEDECRASWPVPRGLR